MDQETKKSGWKIWFYLTPVYILIAIPLAKWTMRVNSSDVDLSKDEYKAFNSQEGEIKKTRPVAYTPELDESGYSLHYKSGIAGEQKYAPKRTETADAEQQAPARAQVPAPGAAERKNTAGGQKPLTPMQQREQKSFGFTKGYLTDAIGKAMNNPKAVSAILNNKYVINGFMSRDTVKAATASPEALANYLKRGDPVGSFMNNSIVKSALNNPQVLSAAASSGMMSALLDTPAGKSLLSNPSAMADLVTTNPELIGLMADPKVMGVLMSNPQASSCISQMNIGGMGKR